MSVISITQTADSIPFSNDVNGYVATNLQDAIEEAGTKSGSPGFSYKTIVIASTVTIPINMEMIVKRNINIYGQLIVRGELVIL
jgi:hypothetical protein